MVLVWVDRCCYLNGFGMGTSVSPAGVSLFHPPAGRLLKAVINSTQFFFHKLAFRFRLVFVNYLADFFMCLSVLFCVSMVKKPLAGYCRPFPYASGGHREWRTNHPTLKPQQLLHLFLFFLPSSLPVNAAPLVRRRRLCRSGDDESMQGKQKSALTEAASWCTPPSFRFSIRQQ